MAELEVTFPPIPTLDSKGAASRPTSWRVYVDGGLLDTNVPVTTLSRRYPVSAYKTYSIQVSLVNELGEGVRSDSTNVSFEQPKGVPSKPGAPGVSLILFGGGVDGGGGSGGSSADWQLDSSRYITSKRTLAIIHPRPDGETNSFARHRNLYPSIAYEIPVGVQGGAYPYKFTLTGNTTLPGASIGETLVVSGDTLVEPSDYGIVNGTAPASGTYTVEVQVEDQEGSTATVSWQVVTSATPFVFIDAVSGNNSNAGTLAAPFQTMLALHSDSSATTTYSQKIVYMRGGQHNFVGISGNGNNYAMFSNNLPTCFLAYPGETPRVDMSGTGWMVINSGGDDAYFSGITWHDNNTSSGNSMMFVIFGTSRDRITFFKNTYEDYSVGSGGSSNPSVTYASSQPSSYFYRSRDTFTGTQGNSLTIYQANDAVIELCEWNSCTFSQTSASNQYGVIYLKDNPNGVTIRRNKNVGNTWSGMEAVVNCVGQNNGDDVEVCYNWFETDRTSGQGGAIWDGINNQTLTNGWFYRNTAALRWYSDATTVTCSIEKSLLENGTHPATGYTITDSVDQMSASDFDADLNLTGTARTTHLGLRGAEIAGA